MLGISVTELRDLVVSLIALVIAFSVLFGGAVLDMNMIIVSTLGVASGFLLHELAHKFTAQHFGYLAEYRANLWGLGLAVASAFRRSSHCRSGSGDDQPVPPPVQTYIQDSMYGSTVPDPFHQQELASQLKREMLLISLAGLMTNIVLAATFFILGMSGLADGGVWAQAITFALFINLILAAFNMLPFGPLDGKKIFDGDRRVWALIGLPVILIALPVYLGII